MDEFKGMTDRESVSYQVERWVDGKPLHNTVRDECCPDFSCCNGGKIMPVEVRKKFMQAYRSGDEKLQWEILGMGLSGLTSDAGVNVYVSGDAAKGNA